jgi:type VI secretion system secreted protein Hcp
MPIYMNITGITGGVSAGGHTGWIQVVGFEWGLGRGVTTPVGNTQDREGDAPSISEIIIKTSRPPTSSRRH